MLRRSSSPSPRSILLVAALGAAFALGGCGIKGPLEPPPGSQAPANADGSKPRNPPPNKPDQPFVLDKLL